MLIEVICETVEDAAAAEQGGADRLELLSDLATEGLSPARATVEAIARAVRVPFRVMLRHRPDLRAGDDAAIARLIDAGRAFMDAGAQGIVVGFASEDAASLDWEPLSRVVEGVGAPATCHRAFEWAGGGADLLREVETRLPAVDRVMTSGGEGSWDDRAARLRDLQQRASRLTVLPAGGVDFAAMRTLASAGLREVHFGVGVRTPPTAAGRVDARKVAEARAISS